MRLDKGEEIMYDNLSIIPLLNRSFWEWTVFDIYGVGLKSGITDSKEQAERDGRNYIREHQNEVFKSDQPTR